MVERLTLSRLGICFKTYCPFASTFIRTGRNKNFPNSRKLLFCPDGQYNYIISLTKNKRVETPSACGGAIIGSRAVLKTAEGKPFQSSSLCRRAIYANISMEEKLPLKQEVDGSSPSWRATTARIHPRRSSLLDGGLLRTRVYAVT